MGVPLLKVMARGGDDPHARLSAKRLKWGRAVEPSPPLAIVDCGVTEYGDDVEVVPTRKGTLEANEKLCASPGFDQRLVAASELRPDDFEVFLAQTKL